MRKLTVLLILLAAMVITAGCTEKSQQNSIGLGAQPAADVSGRIQNYSTNSPGSQAATDVVGGMQNDSKSSQRIQDTSSVVEVTQLEQINTALQKGPVLLKIGAEWCEQCQEMKPILKDLATEYAGKATIMSMDEDKSLKFAQYFGVTSVPDSSVIVGLENGEYVYMQYDGKVSKDRFKARILGLRDKQEFENVLNFALQKENSKN